MRLSKSTQYLSWINLATFIAIAVIYFAFYILITKYLSWKMTELSTEPFSIKSFFQKNEYWNRIHGKRPEKHRNMVR